MLCDICGGTLVMQPGATAKCDCCGMDYSTESLKAKFAATQSVNNIQTESANVYNQNNPDYAVASSTDNEYARTTIYEPAEVLFEQSIIETDSSSEKKLLSELSETEIKLAQFFHDASLAERMIEIRKIWKELGLHEVSELQELNKQINDKAEFERFYGFQNADISALVSDWESEYGIEILDDTEAVEEVNEESSDTTKREYIDLYCPGCNEKLSFFGWQVTVGERFICPYCGESFVLKEEQILY